MVMGRLAGENAEMQKELEVLFLTKEIVITSTNEGNKSGRIQHFTALKGVLHGKTI